MVRLALNCHIVMNYAFVVDLIGGKLFVLSCLALNEKLFANNYDTSPNGSAALDCQCVINPNFWHIFCSNLTAKFVAV